MFKWLKRLLGTEPADVVSTVVEVHAPVAAVAEVETATADTKTKRTRTKKADTVAAETKRTTRSTPPKQAKTAK